MMEGGVKKGINCSCWGLELSQPFKVGSRRSLSILFFAGRMCMILKASDCLLLRDPRNPYCKLF